MRLNRVLQRQLLEQLREAYPEFVDFQSRPEFDQPDFQSNLFYLSEHKLIDATEGGTSPRRIVWASITASGLDFLEDDGGLSAILKTVTVKFDIENIRSILEDKVVASTLPHEEKQSLIRKIKGLSGDMLKSVVIKLMEKGMEHPEQLGTWLDMLHKPEN